MRKCYHAIVYVADKGRHIITMLLLQWKEYLPDIYKYVYYIMMIVLLIKKQKNIESDMYLPELVETLCSFKWSISDFDKFDRKVT